MGIKWKKSKTEGYTNITQTHTLSNTKIYRNEVINIEKTGALHTRVV